MRVVIQRVDKAGLKANGHPHSDIGKGLVVLSGFEQDDNEKDIDWMTNKILSMRIFSDDEGKMNLSVQDILGGLLIVSQFTLHASTKKGNRPSFIKSAPPEHAIRLYDLMIDQLKLKYVEDKVATGVFGAHMDIEMTCNGPVTITIDSKNRA